MTEAAQTGISTPINIINARLLGYEGLQMLSVNYHGIIESIYPMDIIFKRVSPQDLKGLDLAGNWVSLGGIDLQINGALGLAFPDLSPENCHQLPQICQFLWNQGVDGFLPTIVTTSVENIQRSLSVIADFMISHQPPRKTAEILGVHLEGPFLNLEKRGAHPAEYLLPLTIDHVKQVLGDYAKVVKIITLAPELDPTGEVIPYLRSLGITVSLGHSQATAAQAQQAFALGASMVTHAFNAMPGLHHREPGLLGAALVHPTVQCGLIADGQHICPIMIQLVLAAGKYQQGLFLVSDALAPLGLPDGVYPWDTRQIEVKDGTARLPDGTLSGTTLPLLVGVQNLVRWEICDLETAIALATTAPRKAIGLHGTTQTQIKKDEKTYLGQPAHQLLRWHLHPSTKELTWQRLLS